MRLKIYNVTFFGGQKKKKIVIISIPRVGASLFLLTRTLSVYLMRFSGDASFYYIKSSPPPWRTSRSARGTTRPERFPGMSRLHGKSRPGTAAGVVVIYCRGRHCRHVRGKNLEFLRVSQRSANPSSSSGSRRWPPDIRGSVWSSRAAFLIKTVTGLSWFIRAHTNTCKRYAINGLGGKSEDEENERIIYARDCGRKGVFTGLCPATAMFARRQTDARFGGSFRRHWLTVSFDVPPSPPPRLIYIAGGWGVRDDTKDDSSV